MQVEQGLLLKAMCSLSFASDCLLLCIEKTFSAICIHFPDYLIRQVNLWEEQNEFKTLVSTEIDEHFAVVEKLKFIYK